MADENKSIEETLDEDQNEQPKNKRKTPLIIGTILILAIAGGGLFASGILSSQEELSAEEEIIDGQVIKKEVTYYELPEFLVNLNTGGKQVKFLKMKVTLELPNQSSLKTIEPKLPRVRDSFQIYLREIRAEDLQGSAGMERLKEELLLRINKEVYPTKVNNVLFKDILVQ